ncbi:extensin-like protein [Phaeobacter sp. 11ANDIMAR09]|nr:extensin-like protein [Phaeobacter sp. 11ANDIMAR09]
MNGRRAGRFLHLSPTGGAPWLVAVALGMGLPVAQASQAPEVSLRPSLRPVAMEAPQASRPQSTVAALADLESAGRVVGARVRPVGRPVSEQVLAAAALPAGLAPNRIDQSLVPLVRPEAIVEQALFKRRMLRRGAVCGDIEIQGKPIGAVAAEIPGCGAKDAVRVTSVAGVTLSQGSIMTCEMAKALKRWVSKDVETAFGRRNKVVSLRVAAHYACRTRNNRPGARISEHGRGKAIDIAGFKLEDGTLVTVLQGWTARETRKSMRRIWKAACGPFGTVLGPEADRYHRDHFHLDVARHRGGAYCR